MIATAMVADAGVQLGVVPNVAFGLTFGGCALAWAVDHFHELYRDMVYDLSLPEVPGVMGVPQVVVMEGDERGPRVVRGRDGRGYVDPNARLYPFGTAWPVAGLEVTRMLNGDGRITESGFAYISKHASDPARRYSAFRKHLEAEGWATVNGNETRLTEAGMAVLRRMDVEVKAGGS